MRASRQFARFCAVGVSNTALSFVAFAVAVRAGVPYLAASCGAFALGALNGYTLNRVWTFKSGSFTTRGLARYGVVQILGLGANAALLAALVEGLRVASIPAQALVLPAVSVLTFALNRRWTFSAQEPVHVGRVLLSDTGSGRVEVQHLVPEILAQRQPRE
jgi:putative flippase GtrA